MVDDLLYIGKFTNCSEKLEYCQTFFQFGSHWAASLSARLSHRNSVRLSQGGISQKRCRLELPNLHRRLTGRLVSGAVKLFHKFEGGHPERRR